MKKILQGIIGILFIFEGIVLILNSFSGITGFVVFENISKNTGSIFGIVFIVAGAVLLVTRREDYSTIGGYYQERAREITCHAHNDEWIARWELGGIEKALKEEGIKIKRGPEKHFGGRTGPTTEHINLGGRNVYGGRLHKHIYITPDPYDPRVFETLKFDKRRLKKGKKLLKDIFKAKPVPRSNLFKKSSYDPKLQVRKYQ